MTTVEIISAAEARERRQQLLARLTCSEEELRDRDSKYQLGAEELAILDRLDELDFLLGE